MDFHDFWKTAFSACMFHLQQPWCARMTEATCSPSQMLGSDKPTMGGMEGEMQKQSSLLVLHLG